MLCQKYIYTLLYFYSCSLFDFISADQGDKLKKFYGDVRYSNENVAGSWNISGSLGRNAATFLNQIQVHVTIPALWAHPNECDKSTCKGPIKYYEDLQCTPIYSEEDSCCAIRYNCDHLLSRSKDKCYYKGHEYAVGEQLREEDRKPCDIGCTCNAGYLDNAASFSCAIVDCFARPEPGCYLKDAHDQCCSGPQICPDRESNITTCIVDGKTYRNGEGFRPNSDPTVYCYCAEGYQGINEAPFCKADEPVTCGFELRHADEIYQRCSPGFYSNQNPATDCPYFSRCQNDDDVVLNSQGGVRPAETPISNPSLSCTFGNLTLNIGEQLNQATDYSSVCVKCVCEVPPVLTCKRLPDNECDVTANAPFINS